MPEATIEPWLRGTLTEVNAVHRGVLHALQLAEEDVARWCGELSDTEIHERPFNLPSVGFQIRHIARSLDRLLTYAEGEDLSAEQLTALKAEMEADATREAIFAEFNQAIAEAKRRVVALLAVDLNRSRTVGRKRLPTSVGGLLVHIADHSQRHVGQAITTAKVVRAPR
ncbi:hypothetical protein ACPOL_0006 [Acidisarcina polymorpha]|uniref:DinB-like domain-containing protein n=1 Tax=Acidisarcina polymorpha TaxID=2211140 RepID=A0A2Z5FRT9_9BACT|nr:DinB family protein [Acidisarcina polymorpha]AXC09393.1 hypothetical protein ACPOL_0006 [Acidisarcina polymorpha]